MPRATARALRTPVRDMATALGAFEGDVLHGRAPQIAPPEFLEGWRKHFVDEELFDLVVPRRTLARRVAEKEPLTVEESDRALRLARVALEAERVFGDKDKAARWLRTPRKRFGNQSPLALLRTETGAKIVENSLVQVDQGIFA